MTEPINADLQPATLTRAVRLRRLDAPWTTDRDVERTRGGPDVLDVCMGGVTMSDTGRAGVAVIYVSVSMLGGWPRRGSDIPRGQAFH